MTASLNKKASVVETTFDAEARTITFTVAGAGATTLHLTQVSEGNQDRGFRHGMIQRVSDAAARSRDTATGKPADPSVKLAAMAKLVDHYNSGTEDWSPARAEGGTRDSLDRMTLDAVCEASGKDEPTIRAMIAKGAESRKLTPKAYLTSLGGAKLVKPILERMQAEAATEAGLDPDADIEGLIGE